MDYKYNGKELHDDEGLGWANYGFRFYDPSIARFTSVDPLAEKYSFQTAYAYASNNPIANIDWMGLGADNVIITGAESDKAVEELQASVGKNMSISRNSKTGELSYTTNGKLSKDAQQLADAIDDKSVNVHVSAENTNKTSNGQLMVGGAFMGNTLNSDGTVDAYQEINPVLLDKADGKGRRNGSSTLHEVTESYQGARLSQSAGVSSGIGSESNLIYMEAHEKLATKQKTTIFTNYLNIHKEHIGDTKTSGAFYIRFSAGSWFFTERTLQIDRL